MKNLFVRSRLEKAFRNYGELAMPLFGEYNIIEKLSCDHIGCLAHDHKEFEEISKILSRYSKTIKEVDLNNRLIRIFKLNDALENPFKVSKIELFEPKPDADMKNLRFGIEHLSFYVADWDGFMKRSKKELPIKKQGVVGDSQFVKTEIINSVELEFRSDRLGEESVC